MKTKLAIAIALSLFAGPLFAAPTLYGKVDVSLDYLPEKNNQKADRDVIEVHSNVSLIGLKGTEKITDQLSVLYSIEWAISEDGDTNDLSQRNRFIGLQNDRLGKLLVGKRDTPLKLLSSPVESFDNSVANRADIAFLAPGEIRIDNAVVYESPDLKWLGADSKLKFSALLATGEASGIAITNGGAKVAGRGLGDSWSASLVYDTKPFLLGIGYDKSIPSLFTGKGILNASDPSIRLNEVFAAANTARIVSRYSINDNLIVKGLYQQSDKQNQLGNGLTLRDSTTPTAENVALAASIDQNHAWLIGVEYKLPETPWTVKGQTTHSNTEFNNGASDYVTQQYIAGVDYAFNKQLRAYGYAGYLTLEQGNLKDKQPVVGTGLEYKF